MLLKYILLIALVLAVINIVPGLGLDNNQLGLFVIGAVVSSVLINRLLTQNKGLSIAKAVMEEEQAAMEEEQAAMEEEHAAMEEIMEEFVPEETLYEEIPPEDVEVSKLPNMEPVLIPRKNMLTYYDENLLNTGLHNDTNYPQYPLLQQGQFEKGFMTYGQIKDVLNKQRYASVPGYYLANNGKYSKNGIPYEKASELIKASKLNDLYHQHNHAIKWSPHTHLGKDRGYMNWVNIY